MTSNVEKQKDTEEKMREKAKKELVEEVVKDFKKRQEERRGLERSLQLDMNFVCGNQYCDVNDLGEIEEERKSFYWQSKKVFNYIAPSVDMRLAKLARVRPKLAVRPASDDEGDVHSAQLASAILTATCEDGDIDGVISQATVWSETCGTAFYKIIWDGGAGTVIAKTENGEEMRDGSVRVVPVSPFEIYPFSLSEESVENQPSIIQAKAVSVQDIYAAYGVKLEGKDIDEFALAPYSVASHSRTNFSTAIRATLHGYEVVIERYERPTVDKPNGRLVIVAGDELLYDGDLPYINDENGNRTYPFVKQNSMHLAGGFFGASVVDRLIPVQRAYNAIKNRKHEFLNRIAMGVVAVEDGSVDTDELIEDGLVPGKVLVYRQGGTPPEMLTLGSVPSEFTVEEEKLVEEFAKISGVGDVTQKTSVFTSVTSATGLQLLLEQEDTRLNASYESIKRALKLVGRHILRLYRQFASDMHLMKIAGENNEVDLFYFSGSEITSDDVILESDSEINLTPNQRRNIIYEMLDKGLFTNEEGKVPDVVKGKLLDMMGYKNFIQVSDVGSLHKARCDKENITLSEAYIGVKPYDDHQLHIEGHTAFLLKEELDEEKEQRFLQHINEHKNHLSEVRNG